MGPYITVTGYFILGCAVISLCRAIEQLIVKKPETSNYALLLLLLCMTYLQAAMGLFFIGATAAMPLALVIIGIFWFIVAAYLAGPLAFLYYNSLINPMVIRVRFHLVPAITICFPAAWYLLNSPYDYLAAMKQNFFYAGHRAPLYIIMAGAVALIVGYTATILKIELSVRNSASIKIAVRSLIVITAGLLLSPVALITGFALGYIGMSAFGAVVLGVFNLLFIFAHVRYHDFFMALGREVRLARYRKSMLRGLDIDALREQIEYLMSVEKYYHNFDISIKSTADELSITPHQLSWFLNKKMRIDFRNFINRYRVEEAKLLLAGSLGQNVLNVGFHVGFGSKTSFNVTFKEFTGKTPTEFRQEHIKKTGSAGHAKKP
ncbi:MAG: AraC family transcriptional regulator [Spirochaetes bacterium]|nr:AraC family transcriptional regulator [Spirochaetota bacterium]